MVNKEYNISSHLDVSYTMDRKYANIHLFTGQRVVISKDVVDRMYHHLNPDLRSAPNGDRIVAMDLANIERVVAAQIWPFGDKDSPIWHTADDRHIPLVDMTDGHIANSIRVVSGIIHRYPNTKNISHYKQWLKWFNIEKARRNGK